MKEIPDNNFWIDWTESRESDASMKLFLKSLQSRYAETFHNSDAEQGGG